jgi:hypothetical protein
MTVSQVSVRDFGLYKIHRVRTLVASGGTRLQEYQPRRLSLNIILNLK